MSYSISNNDYYLECIDKSNNIYLQIKTLGPSYAGLNFVDDNKDKIKIPKNIVVYTYNFSTYNHIILNPMPNTETYCLCSTDEYEIKYNNRLILHMKPVKGWKFL